MLESRVSGPAILLALGMLLHGCADDRNAGGTTGTEAGNALAVRLRLPDGGPAVAARIVVRPRASVSSRDESSWLRDTADDLGAVELHLPRGEWTLEARVGGFGLRADLPAEGGTTVLDTLEPLRQLSGVVLGASQGDLLGLPGLGLSVVLDAQGRFSLDSIPAQSLPLATEEGVRWLAPDTGSMVLPLATPGLVCREGRRLVPTGRGPVHELDANSAPGGIPVFLDDLGREIGTLWSPLRQGRRRVWADFAGARQGATLCGLVSRSNDVVPSAFAPGLRSVYIPWMDPAVNGSANVPGRFQAAGTTLVDSLEGAILAAGLGDQLGTLDSAGLPVRGPFGVAARIRLVTTGVQSIGWFDWGDPEGRDGLHLGVGGDVLRVRLAGRDTTVTHLSSGPWTNLAVSWNGQSLSVAADGTLLLSWILPGALSDRSGWTSRTIGLGGGIHLSWFLTSSEAIDAVGTSSPQGRLVP